MKRSILTLLTLLSVPAVLLAADTPTPDSVGASAIAALVPVVVMLLVWGVRELLPKIPPILLPIIATAIGAASSFVGGLPTSGSAIRGAALGALAVFLREVLTTLGVDVSVRKLGSIILIVTLAGFGLSACASTQLAKKDGTVALTAAHSAINLAEVTLLRTECGKTGAPPEPACVPAAAADKAFTLISKAAEVGAQAAATVRKLPPSLDGTTSYAAIEPFISQIWALVGQIRDLFPSSSAAEKLKSDLAKLQSKS